MLGLYNNATGLFEDAPCLMKGLWLEQDIDSDLLNFERHQYIWIIPNETEGISEIEGADHIKFVQGPNAGQYVIDVLAAICRKMKDHDPRNWLTAEEWARFGLVPIPDALKRFNEQDGLYHV